MQHQSHTQRSLSQETLLILANQVDEPKTATTLYEAVVQATGLVIEPGTFSRTLAHLEQRGWIEALMTDHPLRLYRITAPGLLAFERAEASGQGEQFQEGGCPDVRNRKEIIMRLVLWMLRLYPPMWRERYETEMVALLEQHEITLWTVLDLLVGALDARLDPHYRRSRQALPLQQLQASWKLLTSALLTFLLSLLLWLNMADVGLAPGQPCLSDSSGCAWAYAVGAHTPPLSQAIIGLGYLTFVLLLPFLLILIGWIVVQVMKSAWNLLRFLPIALFILLLLNNWWNNIVLLIVFMVSIALVAESGGAMLISYRSWEKRHNLLLATLIRLLALLVISGMIVVCFATGVWLVDLWVVFPLFDFGLLIQLLLGFVLMVVATATALVALVRSTVTLRAVSAAPNNTSSLPQRDRTEPKVWIMVLSLGLFVFTGTIMLIFFHVVPNMFLLLSLFAGLVSMMNALAMKKNRVEIADLSNQEPL